MRDFSCINQGAALPDLQLSDESKHVIKGILESKSKNGDGVMDLAELGDCLEAFGFDPDDEDVEFLKKHLDDNGDGELEVHELMDNIDVLNWHCFYGKELMDEFRSIDTDGDRFIRFPEMLRVLTTREPSPLPVLEARQLLDKLARKYDSNFDGKFSYSEFVKIYMSDELPFRNELESGNKPKSGTSQGGASGASADKAKKKVIKKKTSGLKKKPTSGVKTDPKTGTNSRPEARGSTTTASGSSRTVSRTSSKQNMNGASSSASSTTAAGRGGMRSSRAGTKT